MSCSLLNVSLYIKIEKLYFLYICRNINKYGLDIIYGQVIISMEIVYGLRINCHLYIIIYYWCLYGHVL